MYPYSGADVPAFIVGAGFAAARFATGCGVEAGFFVGACGLLPESRFVGDRFVGAGFFAGCFLVGFFAGVFVGACRVLEVCIVGRFVGACFFVGFFADAGRVTAASRRAEWLLGWQTAGKSTRLRGRSLSPSGRGIRTWAVEQAPHARLQS